MQNRIPIKLLIFDLDDTLIYGKEDNSIGPNPPKFMPIKDPKTGLIEKVIDGPNRVQCLMPHAERVLKHLKSLGITLTWASMGPEWQMRRFTQAFQIDQFFDWEIGSYDRRDKGEKVELCLDHFNSRLTAMLMGTSNENLLSSQLASREETVFVDDNLGYLGRVDSYLPGIKVVWAHYQNETGLLAFFEDLQEQHDITLPKC